MNRQSTFSAALLDAARPAPPGLTSWNGSNPAQRFSVYRNNVVVSLVDALAATFPVVQLLVGEDFFRAMARLFAVSSPPRSPILARYGGEYPAFIERFPPASSVPYLADMARLELARVEACHAADAPPIAPERLAAALAEPATLAQLRLQLHPSLSVLRSRFAIVSLWAAHQDVDELPKLAALTPDVGESALIVRVGLDVETMRISDACAAFIAALRAGEPLGRSASLASAEELSLVLGLLIRKGAVLGLSTAWCEASAP